MKSEDHLLGRLASGEAVINRRRSHLHGDVEKYLAEALGKVTSDGKYFVVANVDLGRVIGQRVCVETSDTDEILFAKRQHRKGLTRFVKNRKPKDSSTVQLVLKQTEDLNTYVCLTAYVGIHSEPEPWDPNATENSVKFWETHALIWGTTPIVEGTETDFE